jgi:hypothetical protein
MDKLKQFEFVKHDDTIEYCALQQLELPQLIEIVKLEAAISVLFTVLKIYTEKTENKDSDVVGILSGLINGVIETKEKIYNKYLEQYNVTASELEELNINIGYNNETMELGLIKHIKEDK